MQFVSSPRGEKKGGHSGGTNEVSDEESRICHSESCPKLVSATQSSHAELVSASPLSSFLCRPALLSSPKASTYFRASLFFLLQIFQNPLKMYCSKLQNGGRLLSIFRRIRHSGILKKQSVSEAAAILVVITFLSKIIGYLRTVLVAYYFGASAQVDAFVVAMLIPSLILGTIAGGGIQTVIIPVYTEKRKNDIQKAKLFVNQIFFINLVVLGALTAVMILFPSVFVKIVAYGFSGQRLSLASYFLRYLAIFGFFDIFVGLFVGLLQSEKQFLFPAATLLVANSLIPLSLFLLAPKIGINSWTVGELSFGAFAFSVMFLFLFYKKQFFHSFELLRINWQEIRHFFVLLLPVVLSSGVSALYRMVDKTVASSLPAGSVAALNFAQLIYQVPYGLLAIPIAVSVYPTLSSLVVEKKEKEYAEVLKKTLSLLIFIMVPLSVVLIVYSIPIVKILYQHGAFTSSATSLTAFAVSMYSIGLFTLSANALFQRVFFSFKDTKTPLYITIFVVIFNVAGDVLLSKIWGVGGIGLATALSSIIAFFAYLIFIRRKELIKNFSYKFLAKEGIKTGIASIFVFLTAVLFKNYLLLSPSLLTLIVRFVFVAAVLATVYLLIAFASKSFGFIVFKSYVKKLLNRI